MANVKITALPSLTGANSASTDVLPVVDVSADTTSKMTRAEFFLNVPEVGIGTSGPSGYGNTGKFAVQTASSTDGIVATFANSGSTGAAIQLFQNGVSTATIGMPGGIGGITFAPSGITERMRLDYSGNLGIGVTPSAWGSNYKAIESSANSQFAIAGANVNGVGIYSNAYAENAAIKYTTTGTAARYNVELARHTWEIAPSGTAGNAITFTQAMTLDASGILIVGATSPFASTIKVQSSNGFVSGSDNAGLRLLNTGATGGGTVYANTGAGGGITIGSDAGPLISMTAGTERMRIDAAGNVGIGTSSPAYKISLNAASAIDIETGVTNTVGTSRFGTRSSGNAFAGAFTAGKSLELWSGNGITATLDGSGNVGIGTASPNAASILDAQSTTKGVRFPNMTTTQKIAIANVAGNVVFDTTLGKLCVNSGSGWQTITSV